MTMAFADLAMLDSMSLQSLLQKMDMNNYEEVCEIGTGAFSTVYKGRDRENKEKFVALKKIKIPFGENGIPISAIREISILKQLYQHNHPNIVELLDLVNATEIFTQPNMTLYMVFEHMKQDLATYIEQCPKPGMSSDVIKKIMRQILSGVDFIHSHRIIHRDLKPRNILMSNDLQIKIADFGLSKVYDFDMKLTSVVVTLWYRAPEVILNMPYTTTIDMWSCACIMAELYKLSPIFNGESEVGQLDKIFSVIGLPSAANWPEDSPLLRSSFESYPQQCFKAIIPDICSEGEDLLMKILIFDFALRISAHDALTHPYFNEIQT